MLDVGSVSSLFKRMNIGGVASMMVCMLAFLPCLLFITLTPCFLNSPRVAFPLLKPKKSTESFSKSAYNPSLFNLFNNSL